MRDNCICVRRGGKGKVVYTRICKRSRVVTGVDVSSDTSERGRKREKSRVAVVGKSKEKAWSA